MTVNKYRILQPVNDPYINLRVEMDWRNSGQDDSIARFTEAAVKEVVGKPKDFEVHRFSHDLYNINLDLGTAINYDFYFFGGSPTNLGNSIDWVQSYKTMGFSPEEIYYFRNSFNSSFFKLDFYDLPDEKAQTNYVTVILPVQQGDTVIDNVIGLIDPVGIKIPKMKLDFLGDKEGFFIYWLRDRNFLNVTTLYMTAKFYDAKNGRFIKMMSRPQSSLPPLSRYSFRSEQYFYYKVELDYNTVTYKVYDMINTPNPGPRVGNPSSPIKWYEYVNPQ
jgi:hypothetical protein